MSARSAPATAQRNAVIEGSLREVTLADVLQLLELGRKTGLLRVVDPLGRRAIHLAVVSGRVCGACADDVPNDAPDARSEDASRDADVVARRALGATEQAVRDAVSEALAWTGGRFDVTLVSAESLGGAPGARPRVRIAIDALLMDAARRADEWASLRDRVPGPDAVPFLVDEGAGRGDGSSTVAVAELTPPEWQLVAHADGRASLRAIAERVRRDVLEVARAADGLVRCGVVAFGAVPARDLRSSLD